MHLGACMPIKRERAMERALYLDKWWIENLPNWPSNGVDVKGS